MLRLQIVALAIVALSIAGIAFVALGSTPSPWVSLGGAKKVDEGVSLDEELRVFVVERGPRLMAFSAEGPYEHEPVFYCASSQMFETMRSGSKFDIYGHYFYGPSARGLSRYPVRMRDGEVQIRMGELTPGPKRGTTDVLQPAGPYCVPIK